MPDGLSRSMLASRNVTSSSSSSVRVGHFGGREGILIAGEVDLVAVDDPPPCATSACTHSVLRLARKPVSADRVPGVIQVLRRHDAEKEDVVRL